MLTISIHAQPFKSFAVNPTSLIAAHLPKVLYPKLSASRRHEPIQPVINLLIYPQPIRVSYDMIAALIPGLVAEYQPDYIFHMGMAAGRAYYALETLAHRDEYRIKDVDGRDGMMIGEERWRSQGCPEELLVGWEREDVVRRWKGLLSQDVDVRLSFDPGRFLCDFIFFESLSIRWLEGRQGLMDNFGDRREGKVCFLHVPGDTGEEAIGRGTMVAEAAIRAVVASWESGKRRAAGDFGIVVLGTHEKQPVLT